MKSRGSVSARRRGDGVPFAARRRAPAPFGRGATASSRTCLPARSALRRPVALPRLRRGRAPAGAWVSCWRRAPPSPCRRATHHTAGAHRFALRASGDPPPSVPAEHYAHPGPGTPRRTMWCRSEGRGRRRRGRPAVFMARRALPRRQGTATAPSPSHQGDGARFRGTARASRRAAKRGSVPERRCVPLD